MGSEYIQYGQSKGLDLEICSSDRLAERGEKYDLIILNHVLEHFLDIKKELSAIRDLLTEEGILYIAVPGVLRLSEVYSNDFLKYLQNAHVRHFCHGTLKQVMCWNGFEEICGDEEVRGLYKRGSVEHQIVMNYYEPEIEYLKDLETKGNFKLDAEPINAGMQRASDNIEILEYWLTYLRKGKRMWRSLADRHISEIAIYGGGILGRQLREELYGSPIKIAYLIDRNKDAKMDNLKTYSPFDKLPKVDVVVIATSNEYSLISRTISGGGKYSDHSGFAQ